MSLQFMVDSLFSICIEQLQIALQLYYSGLTDLFIEKVRCKVVCIHSISNPVHCFPTLGHMRGSLLTLQRLVQLFPSDTTLKNDLGVGYLLMGDTNSAKKVYEEVSTGGRDSSNFS